MHGGGLLHTTLTSSASAQGARVSLKRTDNFLCLLWRARCLGVRREGVAIAGYVVWQTTRGSEDATPNTQISSSFEKTEGHDEGAFDFSDNRAGSQSDHI